METNSALVYILIGDYICWTFFFSVPVGGVNFFIYFGSFAFWALKFKVFVGRLIANKRLPITDYCQKLKQKRYRKKQDESIHLENKRRPN